MEDDLNPGRVQDEINTSLFPFGSPLAKSLFGGGNDPAVIPQKKKKSHFNKENKGWVDLPAKAISSPVQVTEQENHNTLNSASKLKIVEEKSKI